MNAKQLIDAAGGHKTVVEITGLSSSAIYNWRQQNYIPKPWVKFFQSKVPAIRKATLTLSETYPLSKTQISVRNSNANTPN
jgi:hypothetical protein